MTSFILLLSIAGISIGSGIVIGVAIGQPNLFLFLGWALMVVGYSLNILVQREVAKEMPDRPKRSILPL